ncbi:uncharacterized protein LOC111055075 [Nilaparvata lugens]|uniref:uncharacterized protein LOC111055075 n=1 Tax=Nilaparvata lugens TaxID=108931 RepID=UPI00193D384A|nr:uncharacterized protein LOC111055075 [Nilaparvata lugens]
MMFVVVFGFNTLYKKILIDGELQKKKCLLLRKVQEATAEIVTYIERIYKRRITKLNERIDTTEMKIKANTSLRAKRNLFSKILFLYIYDDVDCDDDNDEDDDNDKDYENDIHFNSDSNMDMEKTASPEPNCSIS